jgi:hypothetical protein
VEAEDSQSYCAGARRLSLAVIHSPAYAGWFIMAEGGTHEPNTDDFR